VAGACTTLLGTHCVVDGAKSLLRFPGPEAGSPPKVPDSALLAPWHTLPVKVHESKQEECLGSDLTWGCGHLLQATDCAVEPQHGLFRILRQVAAPLVEGLPHLKLSLSDPGLGGLPPELDGFVPFPLEIEDGCNGVRRSLIAQP